jgi:very-short-patch-repair endonuclease
MSELRVSPDRLERVKSARDTWIRRLIDLSRRNNLLYFRDLQVRSLDLSEARADALRDLLRSHQNGTNGVPLRKLVDTARLSQAAASLQKIADKALSNYEERGLDTLFAAVGLATWDAADGGRPSSAPVLLVPIKVSRSGINGEWLVKRSGEVQVNDVLVHALQVEHGVALDSDSLLRELCADEDEQEFDVDLVFERVQKAAKRLSGFTIDRRWVVGNFSFQKLAIVRDLKDLLASLAQHTLIAGIAGDPRAREEARGDRLEPDVTEFDGFRPGEEFLILDADSTQQKAIVSTLAGQNGVISGPPGTGKSQTIANLVAESAARGKTVLFVAEKRAALDVVLNRLRDADLGHLCLDLHGADVSRKLVAEQLSVSLARVHNALEPQAAEVHARFAERRERLNAHVRRLHSKRPPANLSVYEIYGKLLQLPDGVNSTTRFGRQLLAKADASNVRCIVDLIAEAATMSGLVTYDDSSPWVRARLPTPDAVRNALASARRLSNEQWPQFRDAIFALFEECQAIPLRTIGEILNTLETLKTVDLTLRDWQEELYAADLDRLITELAPAHSKWSTILAMVSDGKFRQARREVREFRRGRKATTSELLATVVSAKTQLAAWRARVNRSSQPHKVSTLDRASDIAGVAVGELRSLLAVFADRKVDKLAFADLENWLIGLASDSTTPSKLLRLHEIEHEIKNSGLSDIFGELRARRPEPELWSDIFRHAWLSSCLEDMQLQDPAISAFNGRSHDKIAAEFRRLDEERLQIAVDRVKRSHAERAVQSQNRFSDQRALISKEAHRKARHIPLRQMVAQAADVLLALRPCWMASPLSVSQLIPGDRPYFDLVIFDEASQVLPEDAVTSLLRGRQAVVAGDSRQLPPTTFFASTDLDDEEEDEVGGFESILDQMSAFLEPAWSLDWHYRSRDEALIAFSNRHVYRDRLVTFPGPGRVPAITHRLVPFVPGQGGQEESASREVDQVVELVINHARARPGESLGVIALGIKHADRIAMALERAKHLEPDLEEFFSTEKLERFFVKNLERVQGDERDAIILSVGYGKDASGNLPYRFGPLLQQGGERRLNVAITRARTRMTVVSSFTHHDMDPSRSRAAGVQLLRLYLEYATSGGQTLDRRQGELVPLNEFEQSVYDALTACGLKLLGQHGTSCYRLDLVALHPSQPGRFVLAIECDGATYHSAPTARDRDRLRQQHLEALGWRFHRIWSTDWFLRRDQEIQRATAAFNKAVRLADERDSGNYELAPQAAPSSKRSRSDGEALGSKRSAKPRIQKGLPIDEYDDAELEAVVRWVQSDRRLRTDDEIVSEAVREMGFSKRGKRIVEAIERAIADVKQAEESL